jgi:predicted PurR-regulated permease PerM
MPEAPRRRVVVELPWRTIFRILAAAALVWCLLQLAQTIVVILVAILLAVTLEPPVQWLQRRRVPRAPAAIAVFVAVLALGVGFVWMTWSSVAAQAEEVARSFTGIASRWAPYLPPSLRSAVYAAGGNIWTAAGTYALSVAESASTALAILVLAYVLALYLLLDGDRVRAWILAFVPHRQRARAERTVDEGRAVIAAYAAGNLITSLIAAVTTFAALWALGVPAALFLSLLAGLSDFVPVVGFVVSSIPAIALGFAVSPQTALIVAAFYIAYNTVENYFLSPWAYGSRMRLSDVAVILAFAVGAELAGVIGALLALPIAALYPTVERIWLRDELPAGTVQEHKELEAEDGGEPDRLRRSSAPP